MQIHDLFFFRFWGNIKIGNIDKPTMITDIHLSFKVVFNASIQHCYKNKIKTTALKRDLAVV